MGVVALGLVLGLLLLPFGIAHFDVVPDVCDGATAPPRPDDVCMGAASSFELHQHCFTCHWLQSFRSTLLASGVVAPQAEGACPMPVDAAVQRESVVGTFLPARAPPTSCLPVHS